MAGNILQRSITPVKPKVLDKERIFVYVEEASNNTKGIASFNSNHFLVNAGNVILNTRYLSEAPFDRASLIKLDEDDFKLSNDTTQINWSFAHDKSGSARTNGFGLVKIADNSAGYLKFTDDDNHYLEVDTTKLLNEIDVDTKINNAISTHNSSANAHNDIRELIRNIDLSGKVDKVAGRYYIYNTTNGITLGYPYTDPGTTSGIFQFSGITIDNAGVQIGSSVGGSISEGAALKFYGYQRPVLKVWGEFTDPGLSIDSPLAVLKDVSELQTTMTNYVNTKVAEVNAVIIRNTEPNIVIEATEDTVQEVATQYIVDNYGRQPEANDGLFITLTDQDNDVIKYAYFNNSWINVGINKIDLSNYVDIASEQTITGHKNFTGSLTKNGLEVATETLLNSKIEQADIDAHKILILGANGTIGTNANFVVQDAESLLPYRNNLTEFIFSGIIPVTGDIDLTKEVTIDFGDTSYYLFSAVDTSKRLTLGDLDFALRESLITGYNYLFRTVFFENSDSVGFAVMPDKEDVLSLDSDQMDNYLAEGGLPQGQLAICSKVIINGYKEGAIYRFKITYPSTYEWEELAGGSSVKATDISSGSLEEVDYAGPVVLTVNQMKTLKDTGSVIVGGKEFKDDGSHTFYVDEDSLGELTLTTSGTVITSAERFTGHVRVMIEFETDGMHYGSDFILHPYDTSICLVSYNFVAHTGTAYLDDNGHIQINIPDNLTFTNVKGHFVELGG